MQIDAPGSQFRELLDNMDRIQWRPDELTEGVASTVADRPESEAELVLFLGCILVAGAFVCLGGW